MKKEKLWPRILLSPLVFIYALTIDAAMILLPFTLATMFGFYSCLSYPFIWLLKKADVEVEYMDDLMLHDHPFIDGLLGMTIIIWFPFYLTFDFIITGKFPSTKDF